MLGPEIAIQDIKLLGSKPLGKGCFGEVWKGEVHFNKVAVKIPLVQDLNGEELEDLRRECRIMRDHAHNNICMFLGACTQPGNFRIVTELMDGDVDTLVHGSRHRKPADLSLFQRLLIGRDAAKGVLWLHKTEPPIIHRDLKPANLLIRNEGKGSFTVKVTDFGLSSIKQNSKRLRDGPDGAKGTPLYMSPEVLQMQSFDERADSYAFGVMLWEILTGDDPFSAHDDYDVFRAAVVAGERPRIPSSLGSDLRHFLERLWHTSPGKRYRFDRIVQKLNGFLVDAAVQDKVGRDFWKKHFAGEETAPADTFIRHLLEFSQVNIGKIDIAAVMSRGAVSMYEDPSNVAPAPSPQVQALNDLEKQIKLLKQVFFENLGDDHITLARFGHVLHWHGPVTASPDWLDALHSLVRNKWFFGNYSAQMAERQLAAEDPGAFLVRYSSAPGAYTVVRKHDTGIGHVRVNRVAGGFEIFKTTYPDICDLILNAGPQAQMINPCRGSPFEIYH